MSTGRGVFIVVEGTDGSGKGTQFKKLADRLAEEGHDVATFDFPQYELPSSFFVREYLNGKYGSSEDVGPYTASLFYALDRFQAAPKIREALAQGKVVLANRYVGSNMAHQGTKFQHVEERRGYFIWLDNLEFEMLRIPRPDVSFVLRVPAEIAQSLVDKKEKRSYTDRKRDIHEADLAHLRKSTEVYDDMCKLFPKDFARIDATRDDALLSIEQVHTILWQKVEPLLPAKKSSKGPGAVKAANMVVEHPYVRQTPTGDFEITKEGDRVLDELVTAAKGNVYAFGPKLQANEVAAAMARLAHYDGNVRAALLAPAYDEPSIQGAAARLTNINVVVENASNLLVKKLERGRLATYVERPMHHIPFETKDDHGRYRYFVPASFDAKLHDQYRAYMDQIFNLYRELFEAVRAYLEQTTTAFEGDADERRQYLTAKAREIIGGVLPVAATSTVGVHASGPALESVILNLLSDELPEAQKTGEQMLQEVQKAAPNFLADTDVQAGVRYLRQSRINMSAITEVLLPAQYSNQLEAVRLVDVSPRNELDLVPDMLYAYSSLSLKELREEVATWKYAQKVNAFEAYVDGREVADHRPGRALEKAHYTWDLVSDFSVFRDLQRHRVVDALEWQALTPRYGYSVPDLIEKIDMVDQFEACFDLSLRLHSLIQEAGYEVEAQYATLLGHRMRWRITYNAREAFHLHELRTTAQNREEVRELVAAMHKKLHEVHPITAESMRFVGLTDS